MSMITDNLPPLIIVVPLIGALLCALLPPRAATLAWLIAVFASGFSMVAAFGMMRMIRQDDLFERLSYHLGGWAPPWGIELALDHASAFIAVVVASLSFVATLASNELIKKEIDFFSISRTYAAWLLAIAGLLGLVMTADAFNLFVFFEISSLAAVTLVAMGGGTDRRALIAAFNYLIIGAVGATFYVIGVGFCYAMTGTLNMADLATRLPLAAHAAPVLVGFGFMIVGIMVKAAVFPVHIWLPAAYGYAPSAVTPLLAAVATKASLYILARIILDVFGKVNHMPEVILSWVLIPLSLMAILLGTVLAIYERDVKLMLAQSSIAQIGYITLGLGLGTSLGVQAGFIHIANHAIIKGGMFIALGGVAVALGVRPTIDTIAGLGRKMPITSTGFLLCGLGLIGVPLTAGFFSKLYLVRALLDVEYWLIAAVVLFSSALAVIYLWRLVEALWFVAPQDHSYGGVRIAENPFIYTPLWILAIANIWFGIDATWVIEAASGAAQSLLGGGG